jgi:hypothetical protein
VKNKDAKIHECIKYTRADNNIDLLFAEEN